MRSREVGRKKGSKGHAQEGRGDRDRLAREVTVPNNPSVGVRRLPAVQSEDQGCNRSIYVVFTQCVCNSRYSRAELWVNLAVLSYHMRSAGTVASPRRSSWGVPPEWPSLISSWLVEFRKSGAIIHRLQEAHSLVDRGPKSAVSWMAVS